MEDAHTLSEEYSKQLLPNTIIQLIAAIFGILGNALVLLMYAKYVEDKTGSRYFIPVMALVDLAGSVSNVTKFHVDDTMRYTYPSVFLCKMMSFLIVLTGGFSAHLTLAIALQRYLMICRPLGPQMSKKICRISILVLFMISIGYASPSLKFIGIYNDRSLNITDNVTICEVEDGRQRSGKIYLGILLFFSFINILVTTVLYIPVIKIIYERRPQGMRNRANNVQDSNIDITSNETEMLSVSKKTGTKHFEQVTDEPNNTLRIDKSREQKARKNISVMFLVIIIVYVSSCLTSLITLIYVSANKENTKGYVRNIYAFFGRLNLLNHIANPYIYWFFDLKFRNELRKFCCRNMLG